MGNPNWKQYKRKGLSEMCPIGHSWDLKYSNKLSISDEDKKLSYDDFMTGYIARNPNNHDDIWYVSKKYFDENFELNEQ